MSPVDGGGFSGDPGSPQHGKKGGKLWPVHCALAFGANNMAVGAVYLSGSMTEGFNAITFSLYREVCAAIVLNLVTMIYWNIKPAKVDYGRLWLCGLLMCVNQLAYIWGLGTAGSVVTVCMQPLIPIFTMIMSIMKGYERGSKTKVMGIILATVGTIVMVGPGQHSDTVAGARRIKGGLLILCNTFCMALYYVFQKPLVHKYPPVAVAGWAYLSAITHMAVTAAVMVPRPELLVPRPLWGPLLFWIIGPSILGYAIVNWGNQRLPSSQVAMYGCLQPVLGTMMAMAFLGEKLVTRDVGALGILSGIYLVNRPGRGDSMGAPGHALSPRGGWTPLLPRRLSKS